VLIVEDITAALYPQWPRTWRLASLLHDAPEYVIGDLISPFKTAIGLDYKAFELRLLSAIHTRFGVPDPLPEAATAGIKRADRIAAFYEASVLAGFSQEEAQRYFGTPPDLDASLTDALTRLKPLATADAEAVLLTRFAALHQPAG
jgi:hypothetical protein